MCKGALARAALLLHFAAAALAAQDWSLHRQRAESLSRVAAAAQARLNAFDDSTLAAARRLDTVTSGPITLLAERTLVPYARVLAQQVNDSVRARVGVAVERARGYAQVVRRYRPYPWERGLDREKDIEISEIESIDARGMRWNGHDSAAVFNVLREGVLRHIFAAQGELYRWLAYGYATDSVATMDWLNRRLELSSSPSITGLQCFNGNLRACAYHLYIDYPADPVHELYDARGRRRLAESRRTLARAIDHRAYNVCVAGSDSACVSLLRRFAPNDFPTLSAAQSRRNLAQLAITLGGPDAVERLLATPGAPRERLAAAARMPMDSLIARWQARVRSAHAPSRDVTWSIVAASAFWSVALAALSLRSSRWR